ncbi:cytochrome P450 [Flagelloscypha sp. PMI_526]|nr:cytochrome P450 [Flagelloscypha sp. PMI_526]
MSTSSLLIPPGPTHLLTRVLPLFFPTFFALALKKLQPNAIPIPKWALILASFLVIPLRGYVQELNVKRRARNAGAVLPPQLKDSSFLGLNSMKALRTRFLTGHPYQVFSPWLEEYGPTLCLNLFGERRILTTEPDYIKSILATDFESFGKGDIFMDQMKSLLGTGVFNADGEVWKFHRNASRKFFVKERVQDFDNFDRHAEIAIKLAIEKAENGMAFDFQDLVGRFTLDSATEFLFGTDVKSLEAGLAFPPNSGIPNTHIFETHTSNNFVRSFARGQDQCGFRARSGPNWRLFEFWKDDVIPRRQIIETYVREITEVKQAAREKKMLDSGKVGEEEEPDTLLDVLFESMTDPKDLVDEIINLLVAGRDTTAGLLSFSIYKLAEHPDIAEKLQAEVLEYVGPNRPPTFADIKEMKYLRAFVNEVLRMYPSVPYNTRAAFKDVVWKSRDPSTPDYFVPKGTKLQYSVMRMHRRVDLWGPTAPQFDPNRFLDSRYKEYVIPNPFIFLPFNGGPRICLGQQFAYNEASFFLIKWIQAFGVKGWKGELARDAQPEETRTPWETDPKWLGEKVWPKVGLTMYLHGGMWMRLVRK